MAFYQDAPNRHPHKKNYGSQGSWDDEGAHYNGANRRFGPNAEDNNAPRGRQGGNRSFGDNRGYQGRSDRPQGDRPQGNRSFGDNRGYQGRSDRPQGDRPQGNRSFGDNRGYQGRGDRPQGDRPQGNRSFGDNRGYQGRGDRPQGNRGFGDNRGQQDRRYGRPARPMEDRRPPMGDARPPRREMKPAAPAGYADHEYRAVPAAPVMAEEELRANENLLAGRNPIREALKSGRDIEKLLVQKGELSGSAREIVQMAREAHVPVQEVEKIRLDEIAPHHQGMLAFASAYQYSTVEAMLADAAAKEQSPFLILLDGVTDPHNLGAVIRTAECVGAHGVIVPERRSVGLTPAAVKASAGAVEHMKVARVTNLNRTLEDLKKQGVWAYAVTMDGEDYEQVNFAGGVALVIGAEGEGISRLTLENCDHRVSLPMEGCIDSLNASVAAGVMMYRVLASRRKA